MELWNLLEFFGKNWVRVNLQNLKEIYRKSQNLRKLKIICSMHKRLSAGLIISNVSSFRKTCFKFKPYIHELARILQNLFHSALSTHHCLNGLFVDRILHTSDGSFYCIQVCPTSFQSCYLVVQLLWKPNIECNTCLIQYQELKDKVFYKMLCNVISCFMINSWEWTTNHVKWTIEWCKFSSGRK